MTPVLATVGITLVSVALLLYAEQQKIALLRRVAKTVAALSFVALAYLQNVSDVRMAAFLFCALGDILLLATGARLAFKLGMAAFALGHLAFAVDFLSPDFRWSSLAMAFACLVPVTAAALYWLLPKTKGAMRAMVAVYIVLITFMVASAFATMNAWLMSGAALFFISDLAVARQRFDKESFANKAVGLPLYFAAQILLALAK